MINILDLPQTNSFGGFPPSAEEQITMMIKILNVLDPVFANMDNQHERFPYDIGYVGEVLASVLRNSPMMRAKNPGYDLADGTEVKTATLNLRVDGVMTCQFSNLKGKEEHGAERFMFIVVNPLKNRVEIYTMSVAKFKERWGDTNAIGITFKKQARRFEELENVADRMQVIDENGLRDAF
jgi:hypothetical protein